MDIANAILDDFNDTFAVSVEAAIERLFEEGAGNYIPNFEDFKISLEEIDDSAKKIIDDLNLTEETRMIYREYDSKELRALGLSEEEYIDICRMG